mmetsp:Transcript_11290/g.20037  ORF Transcript_11290/g.20037 Transcript_11290/m.20037 type:complete len:440 (-) Transcript_11290:68-1387(-)
MDSHAEPIHRARMVLPVFLAFTITIILSHPTSSTALSLQRHRSPVVNGTPFARKWKPIYSRPTSLCSTPPGDAVDVGNFISNMGGDSIADGDGIPAQINGGTNGDNFAKVQSSQSPPRSTFFPLVLWRFTRPHTLIGSALAIPSIFLLAAPTYRSFFTLRTFAALSYAVIPSLLMNIYITGLNQITDVEIDKINKPDLPMANGDLKYSTATGVVLASLIISLAMSVIHPTLSTSGLQVALWGSFLLGTLYSLPPIRMKKHPFLAAFCIVAVRGIIVNAGFYSHALSSAFGSAAIPSAGVLNCLLHDRKCALSSFFFGVFGIVIALMKDVPDVDGDRIFNIRSYTVRLGQKRVFSTMKNLLTLLFGVFGGGLMRWSIMTPTMGPVAVRRGLVGLGCWAAGWTVNRDAREVNPEDSGEVYNYYMYLWKLFYLSYLALPFVK